jgi:hypothetical protein
MSQEYTELAKRMLVAWSRPEIWTRRLPRLAETTPCLSNCWCKRAGSRSGRPRSNQRALLKLLFDATAATLLEFGRRTFHGTVGFTAGLHTWDQQLRTHLHLHCAMPAGALSRDRSRW